MGARISIRSMQQGAAGGLSSQSGIVNVSGDPENGTLNPFNFSTQFSTVSSIQFQSINGVGIDIQSGIDNLTVTGSSIRAYGTGQVSYIVTGTF